MVPKFRGWHKELEQMIYGKEVCGHIEYTTNLIDALNTMLNEDDYDIEVMQSTGLKDKNGVEIFEGDIVKILDSVQVNEIDQGGAFVDAHFDELDEVDYIVFSDGGFKLSRTGFDVSICHYVEEAKVIGNIYENPELLEKANES
ncbi:YopX family protein [Enterococcus gallinarum]|uniref:YopX family protein n=1 Tax=Enterococcus gallinarum TaxID=1353 RepID=UPI0035CC6322